MPTNPESAFAQQRAVLVGEIAQSLDHAVQNANQLNRAVEGVVAVGAELGAVEALWSTFEGFMGPEQGGVAGRPGGAGGAGGSGAGPGVKMEDIEDGGR